MKRVLLCNPYGPHELAWGTDMMDVMNSRLARGHGIFNFTSHLHAWALYLIAENLRNPCTVLENPHWEDFVGELGKGYDVVGIQLKSVHTAKVARMIGAVRAHSPKTEIVIGGYGVGALDDRLPGDTEGHRDYILDNTDHLCRAEGVRFMRELLGDTPVERPISQCYLPCGDVSMPNILPAKARAPNFLVALGCPNACEFCNTSAFFYHKKIYVAEPEEIYRFMKVYQQRLGVEGMVSALFDEDIFLNPEYVRELGRLIRSDRKTWGLRWFGFGSLRAVSEFEPEELRECGVASIWIGVESGICEEGKSKTGYAKRDGAKDPRQVFAGLQSVGIQTVGSTILGFDFHTPENIEEDIDYFVSLKPTLYQIAPLTPCPGTRLFDKMAEQRRLSSDYDWTDLHVWKDDVFEFANFRRGEIKQYYERAHQKLRTLNGPPIVQIFEETLNAYEKFRDSPSEFLRFQARQSGRMTASMLPVLRAIANHPPSPQVRQRVRELEQRAGRALGPGTPRQRLAREAAGAVLDWRLDRAEPVGPRGTLADPPVRWTYYNQSGAGEPSIKRGRRRGRALAFDEDARRRQPGGLQRTLQGTLQRMVGRL